MRSSMIFANERETQNASKAMNIYLLMLLMIEVEDKKGAVIKTSVFSLKIKLSFFLSNLFKN